MISQYIVFTDEEEAAFDAVEAEIGRAMWRELGLDAPPDVHEQHPDADVPPPYEDAILQKGK